jgi:hypothetical protein
MKIIAKATGTCREICATFRRV